MFILGDKKIGFQVHFNATDIEESLKVGENLRVTLTADQAKELEDLLEEALKRGITLEVKGQSSCRVGYCAEKGEKYKGGWNQDLEEGRCPVCKGKLVKKEATL